MSKADEQTVNWEPYEAEILSLYVDQNQTLEATMAHMKDKYGLRPTYSVALLVRVEASTNSTAVQSNIRPNSQATRI
jgi:Clr5 domain